MEKLWMQSKWAFGVGSSERSWNADARAFLSFTSHSLRQLKEIIYRLLEESVQSFQVAQICKNFTKITVEK